MNITILGAAGFIGTNLAIALAKDNHVTVVDQHMDYFSAMKDLKLNVIYREADFTASFDYDELLENTDVLYHLISTTAPSTSNKNIAEELTANVVVTSEILEACVRKRVKKVVFISSGGTVYGKDIVCPVGEETTANPISSYGIQKLTIEKLLYLYNYLYNLDYRIIRLANPYGPYQRPNGVLGVVTTFTYKALKKEEIVVYGDGTVVRDFIYIDDAVRGILNIVQYSGEYKLFNLGQGKGTSVNQVIHTIEKVLGKKLPVKYLSGRKVDVPVNYLDINRYESACGNLNPMSLETGISKTLAFMRDYYE